MQLGHQRLVDTTRGRGNSLFKLETSQNGNHLQSLVDQSHQQTEKPGAAIVTFCSGTCVPKRQPLLTPLEEAHLHTVGGWHRERPTESARETGATRGGTSAVWRKVRGAQRAWTSNGTESPTPLRMLDILRCETGLTLGCEVLPLQAGEESVKPSASRERCNENRTFRRTAQPIRGQAAPQHRELVAKRMSGIGNLLARSCGQCGTTLRELWLPRHPQHALSWPRNMAPDVAQTSQGATCSRRRSRCARMPSSTRLRASRTTTVYRGCYTFSTKTTPA